MTASAQSEPNPMTTEAAVTSLADLAALVKRVEEAPEGDMELDADIWLFGSKEGRIEWAQTRYTMEAYPVWVYPSTNHLSGFGKEPVPRLTSSLDEAVGFVARVLPGWTIARLSQDDNKRWHAELRRGHLTSYDKVVFGADGLKGKASAALTLILAALRALSAAGDEDRRA